ncbi:MAG: hypothetical protein QOC93_3075 [Actinomycetota bacterium]|jgi:hypothetical protein|nr:hypothetical protein [Actinomycetota bacterium]
MSRSGKFVVVAAIAVAAAGLGGGRATAQPAPHAAPRPVANDEPTTPDTDTLRQGDQTTPDRAAPQGAVAVHPVAHRGAVHHAQVRSDGPGEENNGENENQSDGPGGHEDPPGDVQHEGGPDEP